MGVLDAVTRQYRPALEKFANKFFDLSDNTLTGTMAQFNTACTDGDFVSGVTNAAAVASTLALRDANANLFADSFVSSADLTTTAAGTTVLTADSKQIQVATGTTTQTYQLASVPYIQLVVIGNGSTGNVSITSSNGGAITTIVAGQIAVLIALQASPTSNAHWLFFRSFTITSAATGTTIAQRDGNSLLFAANMVQNFNSIVGAGGTTVMSVSSAHNQELTGTAGQTYTLPSSSVVAGMSWEFFNAGSSGTMTINSSGGNLVKSVAAGGYAKVTSRVTSPTTAANWLAP